MWNVKGRTLSRPNPRLGSSPTKASAGGHELHPCDVKSSTSTTRFHDGPALSARALHPATAIVTIATLNAPNRMDSRSYVVRARLVTRKAAALCARRVTVRGSAT